MMSINSISNDTDDIIFSPSGSTWTVKWDDEVIVAPSAYDILATIGERSYIPADHKYPKRGIAYRTFVQYRIVVDDELTDEAFLMKLAEFGIIELSVQGDRPPDILSQAVDFSVAWHGGKK
jgi:hypothetical protein